MGKRIRVEARQTPPAPKKIDWSKIPERRWSWDPQVERETRGYNRSQSRTRMPRLAKQLTLEEMRAEIAKLEAEIAASGQ